MSRGAGFALVAAAAVVAAGCARRDAPTEATTKKPPAAASAPVKPVDHLAPGELVEGTTKALGLLLPKAILVERSFSDVVYATGPVPPERVAHYITARVRGGAVVVRGSEHSFQKVVAVGETRPLNILVGRDPTGGGTRLEIRDVTPPVLPPEPDEAARWRAVGMKPSGEPIDRTQLK